MQSFFTVKMHHRALILLKEVKYLMSLSITFCSYVPWYPLFYVPLSTVNTLIGPHDKPGQMYAPLIKQCVLIMVLPKAFKYFCYYSLL